LYSPLPVKKHKINSAIKIMVFWNVMCSTQEVCASIFRVEEKVSLLDPEDEGRRSL
jgi:hypothetical protein